MALLGKLIAGYNNPGLTHFLLLFIKRLINASLVITYYAPDEYWQSVEVAHHDTFGYGYLTWEWTREAPLRNSLYVQIYTALYTFLKWTNLDTPFLVAYSPRLIAALQAATFDFYLLKLTYIHFGTKYVRPMLSFATWISLFANTSVCLSYINTIPLFKTQMILHTMNWYTLFGVPRLLFNVFEMTLFTITLYYHELGIRSESRKYDYLSRFVAILNFIAKPTSVIPLTFLWPYRLLTMPGDLKEKAKYLVLNIVTVIAMIIGSIVVDVLYFKKLTWTAFNFFQFNFLETSASLYGIHSNSWYFFQGLPYLLLGYLPFFIFGVYWYICDQRAKKSEPTLVFVFIYVMLVLSLIQHKEDRFLMPIFPIIIMLTAYGYINFRFSPKLKATFAFLGLLSNIGLLAFMGFYHNRASFSIMDSLRDLGDKVNSVYIFTECHQTPFYSFIHRNIPMDFPDCRPENRAAESESKQLFTQPTTFIERILTEQAPSHIVILNHFLRIPEVISILQKYSYSTVEEQHHAFFIDSPIGDLENISLLIMEKKLTISQTGKQE